MHAAEILTPSHPQLTPSSLTPRPDMADHWIAHAKKPISFDDAITAIRNLHVLDGARRDVITTDLSSWALDTRDVATRA